VSWQDAAGLFGVLIILIAYAGAALGRLDAEGAWSLLANLVGAVLTKFDAKKVGYGTDYAYGYSYEYGSEKKPRGA